MVGAALKKLKKRRGSDSVSVHQCPGRKSLELVDKAIPFKREDVLLERSMVKISVKSFVHLSSFCSSKRS